MSSRRSPETLRELMPTDDPRFFGSLETLLKAAGVHMIYVVTPDFQDLGRVEISPEGLSDHHLVVEVTGLCRQSGGELYRPTGLFPITEGQSA